MIECPVCPLGVYVRVTWIFFMRFSFWIKKKNNIYMERLPLTPPFCFIAVLRRFHCYSSFLFVRWFNMWHFCSSSLLILVLREGCVSWLCHLLSILTCIIIIIIIVIINFIISSSSISSIIISIIYLFIYLFIYLCFTVMFHWWASTYCFLSCSRIKGKVSFA